MEEHSSNPKKHFWLLLFVGSLTIDSILIFYFVIEKISLFIYTMVAIALGGLIYMNLLWNNDERTEKALESSARATILVYSVAMTSIGILFIVLSDLGLIDLWNIGTTLCVCIGHILLALDNGLDG